MRKFFSLILVISILFTVVISAEQAELTPKIKIRAEQALPGRSVDVAIVLENNPGIVAMKLELSYDDTYLTLKKVNDMGVLGTYFGETNDLTDNPYTLCWADLETETDIAVNGTIAVLTFDIAKDAPEGEYAIELSYNNELYEIMNVGLEPVDFLLEEGGIKVGPKATISIESVPAKAGGEVYVNINISDNPNAQKLSFDLSYNKEVLELAEVLRGNVYPGAEFTLDKESFPAKLKWEFQETSENGVKEGLLATLKFKVSDTAVKGKYDVTGIFTEDGMTDGEGLAFMFEVTGGKIDVLGSPSENIPGDANGDGKVNSNDAIYLSMHIESPDKFPIAILGDLNKDEATDLKDAIYLLKHTLLPDAFPVE